MKKVKPRCHACKHLDCAGGKDCFKIGEETLALYRKDRVLAHNPVGAVYSPYVNRRLREGLFAPND